MLTPEAVKTVHEIAAVVVKHAITLENLPKGLRWEPSGACFEAVACDGCDGPIGTWRWAARNLKALRKGNPTEEMFDHAPAFWISL